MKLEIYRANIIQPITLECDRWEKAAEDIPTLKCLKNDNICAEFFLEQIVGFKEVSPGKTTGTQSAGSIRV